LNPSWEAETSSTWKLIFVLGTKLLISLFCNILYTVKDRTGKLPNLQNISMWNTCNTTRRRFHKPFPKSLHIIHTYRMLKVQQIHLFLQLYKQEILSHITTFNITSKTQNYFNLPWLQGMIEEADPDVLHSCTRMCSEIVHHKWQYGSVQYWICLWLCLIWGSHSCGYERYCLLRYNAV
jgi:hypothetical protein